MKDGKIIIEVELDLTDAMEEAGIEELTDQERSMFEFFVEKQLEAYNPDTILDRLEVTKESNLGKIFREGFYISATLQ